MDLKVSHYFKIAQTVVSNEIHRFTRWRNTHTRGILVLEFRKLMNIRILRIFDIHKSELTFIELRDNKILFIEKESKELHPTFKNESSYSFGL